MMNLNKPRSISQVLSNGFSLYSYLFKNCFWLVLLLAIISSLFPYHFNIGWYGAPVYLHSISLVSIFLIDIVIVAMMYFLERSTSEEHISISEALSVACRKVIYIVCAQIIYLIAVFVGGIFFVLPGILLLVLLYFFLPAIAIENQGILSSLSRSSELVWGNWWHTFIAMFVAFFITGAVATWCLFLFVLMPYFLAEILRFFLNILIAPIIPAVMFALFKDLQARACIS